MLSQVVWRILQHSYLYLCILALKHSMPNRTIRTRPISVKNSSTIGRSDFLIKNDISQLIPYISVQLNDSSRS